MKFIYQCTATSGLQNNLGPELRETDLTAKGLHNTSAVTACVPQIDRLWSSEGIIWNTRKVKCNTICVMSWEVSCELDNMCACDETDDFEKFVTN